MSKEFSIDESNVLNEIMQYRRDVRGNRFIDKPISNELIDKVLTSALSAPSVGYSQPWRFVLIDDKQVKQKVLESFNEENQQAKTLFSDKKQQAYQALKLEGIVEAPLNIAVFYKPSQEPTLGQTSMAEVGKYSVVCAIQNMWLMARSLNIGMGWVSIVDPEKVKAAVNAPEDNELIAYLCLGYVDKFLDEPELKIKNWQQQKNKEELIFRNSFDQNS
ncbi:5,6-dimethylbenzimidazole synthase [Pseudocolwellia sp. HL-MZ19]|uniref:5,6-dimethylbenzimidazole synthase n=1 Tax=unclassified Pseudocolwellia TaxID=2848178 RepID=UPI003CE8C7BD